jgi:hypothetical protein
MIYEEAGMERRDREKKKGIKNIRQKQKWSCVVFSDINGFAQF